MNQDFDYVWRKLSRELAARFNDLPSQMQIRMTHNALAVITQVAQDGKGMSQSRGDDFLYRLVALHQKCGILSAEIFSVPETLEGLGYKLPLSEPQEGVSRRRSRWRASEARAEYRATHPPKPPERRL